jgi:hypothetical protein
MDQGRRPKAPREDRYMQHSHVIYFRAHDDAPQVIEMCAEAQLFGT